MMSTQSSEYHAVGKMCEIFDRLVCDLYDLFTEEPEIKEIVVIDD